ncbi:MAG: hypothetical protein NTAFB09_15910 [Nitrosospira sp.]
MLADLNRSRILDIIPFGKILLANAIALSNAVQRVSLTDDIGIGWLTLRLAGVTRGGSRSGPIDDRGRPRGGFATGEQQAEKQAENEKQTTY